MLIVQQSSFTIVLKTFFVVANSVNVGSKDTDQTKIMTQLLLDPLHYQLQAVTVNNHHIFSANNQALK